MVLYSTINFLILAVVLFLVGRKFAANIFNHHQNEVEEGLEQAEKGRKLAENIGIEKEQTELQFAERLSCLSKELDDLGRDQKALEDSVRQTVMQESLESLSSDEYRYRLGMLKASAENVLNNLSIELEKYCSEELFKSKFRAREQEIVEQILSMIELSPGDFVYMQKHEVLYVTLTSAFELQPEMIEKIRIKVKDLLDNVGGKPSLWVRVDSSLIGGLSLRIGDTVFDGTISGYLYRLRSNVEPECDPDIDDQDNLGKFLEKHIDLISTGIDVYQLGRVLSVSDGICYMDGLADIMYGELVEFACGETGMVLDIEDSRIACAVFGAYEKLQEGERVRRVGRVMDVPVGERFLGRVVNAMGEPIDGKGEIRADGHRPIEFAAPAILDRRSVSEPLHTGLTAIDALVPIGKGQRELIIGDRQTGKTAIAIDTILNQRGKNVICIYVAIGQKETTVAGVVETLRKHNSLNYTIIMSADAYNSAPMQYIAPYAATAMGEYFMYNGRDVLIIYDDLSKHAVAYREISLLLHRPSGREAYPGDVFYLHSRLLERSACLAKGGSMTALPIIETQAGDISTYIPTNVISITDGQIFLETDLFHQGVRPAINVGLSVSRVGGAAQTGAMKQVSGQLRMNLAQYRELQTFSQFGSDLDASTRASLALGARMTALLKQPQYSPIPINRQVLMIFAVSNGFASDVEPDRMDQFAAEMLNFFDARYPELLASIDGKMTAAFCEDLRSALKLFKASIKNEVDAYEHGS